MLDSLLEALGLPVFSAPGFEADDVLATLARRLQDQRPLIVRQESLPADALAGLLWWTTVRKTSPLYFL